MKIKFYEALYVAYMDLKDIKPEAKRYADLIGAMNTDLIPTQAVEVTPDGPLKRIAFISEDQTRKVGFLSERLEVVIHFNENISIDDGAAQAVNIINASTAYLNIKPSRLGFFIKAIYPSDLSNNIMAKKFINNLAGFDDYETVAPWAWKRAWKAPMSLGGQSIDVTLFGSIEHGTTEFIMQKGLDKEPEVSSYEGYLVNTDVNTGIRNQDSTFGPDETLTFFREAVQWHSSIRAGIEKLMGVSE